MFPQISKALSSGFTSRQIINYLLRKFPQHSKKINNALAAGFTADQVVKYLGGGKKEANKADFEEAEDEGMTPYSKTLNKDIKGQENRAKTATYAGLGAVGGIGAGMAARALSRAVPTNLLGYIPGTQSGPQSNPLTSQTPMGPGPNSPGVQVMGNPKGPSQMPIPQGPPPQPQPISPSNPLQQQSGIQPSQPPVNANSLSQKTQQLQPQRDVNKSFDAVIKSGHEPIIKNLVEGGMDKRDIYDALGVMLGKKRMKELDKLTGGFEDAIEDYAQKFNEETSRLSPVVEGQANDNIQAAQGMPEDLPIPEQEIIDSVEEAIEPFKKADTVITDHGIGQVKEIRNGKALVEVDGKIHKVDESDLEKTLFTDDEIANKYDELMEAIPESERSGFISWAGYDEDTNEIGFIPRGGKYEVLTNITPEEAKKIKDGKGIARTTGANREGLWVQGEDTRGGVISQIIHDRRKLNKKEEDKQGKFDFNLPKREKEDKGMKPLFDEMAYARGLSQEREKKKALEAREKKKRDKEAEKERIKREKNEAKKRKKSS